MTFVPLEAEERAKQKEIRWISLNGNPISEKMTTTDYHNCLPSLVNSATPLISGQKF